MLMHCGTKVVLVMFAFFGMMSPSYAYHCPCLGQWLGTSVRNHPKKGTSHAPEGLAKVWRGLQPEVTHRQTRNSELGRLSELGRSLA